MDHKKVIAVIFESDIKPPDSFAGWTDYGAIALRDEFFVVRDKKSIHEFEYAFNYDGTELGFFEDITAGYIDKEYWILLFVKRDYDLIQVLYYKTPNGLKKIFEFPHKSTVFKSSERSDKEKVFVRWYPIKGKEKSHWFFSSGEMKKAKKE